MAWCISDRTLGPGDAWRPCETSGLPMSASGYLSAVGMGIERELCPYGSVVGDFPLHPEARSLADGTPAWHRLDGVGLPVPCPQGEPGAEPDIPALVGLGLLPTPYDCPLFGNDCPVFYGLGAYVVPDAPAGM